MDGRKNHAARGPDGRFAAARRDWTELERGRGGRLRGLPQIRSKHERALTRSEVEALLESLAETCNVSQSALECGRSARTFFDLKRRDGGFRAAWSEALREGYDRLELEMVRRARFGTPRSVFFRGRKTKPTRVLNHSSRLPLLAFHRKSVETLRAADRAPSIDAEAIFDALAARLAEIEAEARRSSAGATRGRADRRTGPTRRSMR